jgi:hypothetical protein
MLTSIPAEIFIMVIVVNPIYKHPLPGAMVSTLMLVSEKRKIV